MERMVKCGHIQCSNAKSDGSVQEIKEAMIEKHIPLIVDAGEKGVQILCLQEIFHGPYFCAEQDIKWYESAETVPGPLSERFAEYAKKYGKEIDRMKIDGLEFVSCDMGKNYDVIFQKGPLMGGVLSVEDQNLGLRVASELWRQLR